MLSEEALVLLAAAGAVALLVLGVLELIAPTQPRHPRRPPTTFVRDPWRRARRPSASGRRGTMRWAAPAEAQAEPPIDFPLGSARESQSTSIAAIPPSIEPELEEPIAVPPPGTAAPVAMDPAPMAGTALEEEQEPTPEGVVASSSPIDRCYELYEAGQFDAVVQEGMAALETASSDPRVREPEDVARLWGVVGLAQQALGDHDAAREALAEAITAAPDVERPTWERHLASLVLRVGQELQARADDSNVSGPQERVEAVRSAISWFDGGVALAPDDEPLRDAARSARAALWSTYEHVAMEQMQRQDYGGARRLLEEALEQADCPPSSQETFRELLAGTHSGAVGQLTAEALRRMREGAEREALAALDEAEALLATLPEDGLPERRRQELERRLWWSYTKVGIRWLEGGMYEQALPPLLHALRFGSVGVQRLDETRRPLARALSGLLEDRTPLVQRLIDSADYAEARVLCDTLCAHVQDALDQGMSKEDLGDLMKRLHELRDRLDQAG